MGLHKNDYMGGFNHMEKQFSVQDAKLYQVIWVAETAPESPAYTVARLHVTSFNIAWATDV